MLGFVFALVLAAGATQQSPATSALPYERLARDFLALDGLEEAEPGKADFETVLASRFGRLPLGALDVRFPAAALADRERQEDFRTLSRALVTAQVHWLDWVEAGKPTAEGKAARKDAAAVDSWISGWKGKELAKIAPGPEADADLLELLAPPARVREAAERFAAHMRSGAPSGGTEERPAPRIVLVPSRSEFVGFACAVGLMDERQKPHFWVPGVSDWTEFRVESTRVIALEFSAGGGDYSHGIDMSSRNPNGMQEQVVQLALCSLLADAFGDGLYPDFVRSIGNNLVIEQFGEVDTHSDGDTSSRTSSAVSAFVPGGASGGGGLPTNLADGPWRSGHGKDHFARVLRAAQKQGGKQADDKQAVDAFLLTADDGKRKHVTRAPFLGPAAADAPTTPKAFAGDRQEFLRAYLVAFVHWLREEGAGRSDPSYERFSELLRTLADPSSEAGEADLAASIQEVYGMPLSSKSPGKEDLEGRFLIWLSKQK